MTLNQSKTAIYTGTSQVLMAIIAGIGSSMVRVNSV
jgi:hypothetical protein